MSTISAPSRAIRSPSPTAPSCSASPASRTSRLRWASRSNCASTRGTAGSCDLLLPRPSVLQLLEGALAREAAFLVGDVDEAGNAAEQGILERVERAVGIGDFPHHL